MFCIRNNYFCQILFIITFHFLFYYLLFMIHNDLGYNKMSETPVEDAQKKAADVKKETANEQTERLKR